MKKTIWDLELHEIIRVGLLDIMRVSGGWIYTNYNVHEQVESAVFVPFNTDLRPPIKME